MERMSARFVGNVVGKSAKWVYALWEEMGIVTKDKLGDWILTDAGKEIGGKMSRNNYCPVPTFDFEVIEKLMIDFYNKHHMKN
ncbi:MAG: hypothetical protein E7558_06390 [Ruminococcaceae bacterium]|nr:hypothetical protein [Oscillospiraceae bacterium]